MIFFLVGSLVLHLKTLLLLLGKIFRRAKVTNFSFGDENFARRIVSPDKVLPDKVSTATRFQSISSPNNTEMKMEIMPIIKIVDFSREPVEK